MTYMYNVVRFPEKLASNVIIYVLDSLKTSLIIHKQNTKEINVQ